MQHTVTHGQILARGFFNRCPNCGGKTLFQPGSLFKMNRECPRCGLKLERDEGFFLGSMSLNYGVTILFCLVPVLVLYLTGMISGTAASITAAVGAIGFPILFYRSSRSWWLMNYYIFFPQHLPANQGVLPPDGDQNL
jgi:uncharacterized protein (DUF983 family)